MALPYDSAAKFADYAHPQMLVTTEWVAAHVAEANLRIVEGVGKALGLPPEKVPHNIERYGNTTAGTIPLATRDAIESGRLKKGDLAEYANRGRRFGGR